MREVIVMKSNSWMKTLLPSVGLAICLLFGASASAHCDSFDGPIIPEALEALEDGEVQPLLRWVEPEREEEIMAALERASVVAAHDPGVRDVAGMWLLEAVVSLCLVC